MDGVTARSELLAYIRGELVGPSVPFNDQELISFEGDAFHDKEHRRQGAIVWEPSPGLREEVLYYQRESPSRKYGIGMLHPEGRDQSDSDPAEHQTDHLGIDDEAADADEETAAVGARPDEDSLQGSDEQEGDEFEVVSQDIRKPSSLGISCCVRLPPGSTILVQLPRKRRFFWQQSGQSEFALNGRYERCVRIEQTDDDSGSSSRQTMWRRRPALEVGAAVSIDAEELTTGRRTVSKRVPVSEGSPLNLSVQAFARPVRDDPEAHLLTVVLRNQSQTTGDRLSHDEAILYQTFFSVSVPGGGFLPYPERDLTNVEMDRDQESLELLYRESKVWAVGHGCAAGWDEKRQTTMPAELFVDVLPGVETPSMTPDIYHADGRKLRLKMSDLAELPDHESGQTWSDLRAIVSEYQDWIERCDRDIRELPERMKPVASRHMESCRKCLERMIDGLELLASDATVRRSFRLANRAMLLQQIATKHLKHRRLRLENGKPILAEKIRTPEEVLKDSPEEIEHLGGWRAFQIAFLLMELRSTSDPSSPERETVDLIWFPTGGGKTEAYLGVAAFYLIHRRFSESSLPTDGTGVLMRYTLRMLTTQQFQRAASLVTALEFMRQEPDEPIPGERFSIGLWIGGEATPNDEDRARRAFKDYKSEGGEANPFVLTECPWCRAGIGAIKKPKRGNRNKEEWEIFGVTEDGGLYCTDRHCLFGARRDVRIPVEVVDTRIYRERPSLVIATADKFAMAAYRPDAGSLFGLGKADGSGRLNRTHSPPGLIIQDEMHLIAGPLGTIYGLYETVIERLCSEEDERYKPKIIASTATIRGARDQVRAIYGRVKNDNETNLQLFPPPGITIGDSFFGVYAKKNDDGSSSLAPGRLYLGIHANDYGSILTAQVRAFAAALSKANDLPEPARDPWWTLLSFYNSIRELGGGKTLFDSDIRSRLKFIHNREGVIKDDRRYLTLAQELTSRLSQAEIVRMMDKLAITYSAKSSASAKDVVDACLASSIIEVGVDIDRLSLMGIVGQPKTTSQYIQVSGRIGRKWKERPGLVLTLYSPGKSRDRSHYEQFHTYHRRLYERVEPTSATPYSPSAIKRALGGVLLLWARQHLKDDDKPDTTGIESAISKVKSLIEERNRTIQNRADVTRSQEEIDSVFQALTQRLSLDPVEWEKFPPEVEDHYLMLWPGQYYEYAQKQRGVEVPSSMRQVDSTAALEITQLYSLPGSDQGGGS